MTAERHARLLKESLTTLLRMCRDARMVPGLALLIAPGDSKAPGLIAYPSELPKAACVELLRAMLKAVEDAPE